MPVDIFPFVLPCQFIDMLPPPNEQGVKLIDVRYLGVWQGVFVVNTDNMIIGEYGHFEYKTTGQYGIIAALITDIRPTRRLLFPFRLPQKLLHKLPLPLDDGYRLIDIKVCGDWIYNITVNSENKGVGLLSNGKLLDGICLPYRVDKIDEDYTCEITDLKPARYAPATCLQKNKYPMPLPSHLYEKLPPPDEKGLMYIDIKLHRPVQVEYLEEWDGVFVINTDNFVIGQYLHYRYEFTGEYTFLCVDDIEDLRPTSMLLFPFPLPDRFLHSLPPPSECGYRLIDLQYDGRWEHLIAVDDRNVCIGRFSGGRIWDRYRLSCSIDTIDDIRPATSMEFPFSIPQQFIQKLPSQFKAKYLLIKIKAKGDWQGIFAISSNFYCFGEYIDWKISQMHLLQFSYQMCWTRP